MWAGQCLVTIGSDRPVASSRKGSMQLSGHLQPVCQAAAEVRRAAIDE